MARNDCIYFYDETLRAINSMSKVLESDCSVQLNKEQCKQMIRAFLQVGNHLGERGDLKMTSKYSLVLKELYRQTIAAIEVLESCCCCRVHEFPQKIKTKLSDSWLEVAITQSRMVFKVILDDLNWCSRLLARDPSQTIEEKLSCHRYNSLLTQMDQEAIERDMIAFRKRLDDLGPIQERDRSLANFLRATLDSNDSEDANNFLWKRTPSDSKLDDNGLVWATSWLGIRVVRKVFQNPNLCFEREIKIMKSLDHPNVVRFITCSKQDATILMERVDTTLGDHLNKHPRLTMLEKVDIMYQIASVMAYLHGNGVAHCGIKPANLLVNPCKVTRLEGYVHLKIADFGLSVSGLNEETLRSSSWTDRGTTNYRAPELKGTPKSVDFRKADVFSYALTCWHILHGKAPFAGMPRREHQQALVDGKRPAFDSVPLRLQELITRCWSTEPKERPTFSEISMALETFKEELLLGFVPSDQSISGLENKTSQKWEALESACTAVKALAVQIRPPHLSACFTKQKEEYVFPGPDHENVENSQTIPSTSHIEDREPEQLTPAPSRFTLWKLRLSRCLSQREEVYIFPGPGPD